MCTRNKNDKDESEDEYVERIYSTYCDKESQQIFYNDYIDHQLEIIMSHN